MHNIPRDSRNIFNKMEVRHYTGHRKRISTLDWSCDGDSLASASLDGTIRLWSLDNSGLLKKGPLMSKAHDDIIDGIGWNPKNPNILASASIDGIMKIWDIRQGDKEIKRKQTQGQNFGLK